jgi:hypothetical protein
MSEITPAQKTALLKLEGFKEIQKQYAKESKMAGSGKRRMKGRGFWDDVGAWFRSVGTSVNDFLKRTKLISNVAGAVLPILAPMGTALLTLNPLAAAASVGAAKATAEGIKSLGYGSKSMMKGKMHGGAIDPSLQALGKFGLNLFSPLAGMALQTGLDLINKPPKMKGKGNDPLAINLPNQRMKGVNPKSKMRGAGYGTINNTVGVNGVPQRASAPAHSGMIGNLGGKGKGKPAVMKGMGGTEYNTVSSEFGNVQF